jgi:hypothetical protein
LQNAPCHGHLQNTLDFTSEFQELKSLLTVPGESGTLGSLGPGATGTPPTSTSNFSLQCGTQH